MLVDVCRSPSAATPTSRLSFGLINICSLNNKVDDLLRVRRERGVDVLCLVETWHNADSVCLRRLRLDGYRVVDWPRPRLPSESSTLSTNHGGVAIISTSGVRLSMIALGVDPASFELLCARVVSGSFTSIVIYQPGAVTSAFFDDLSEVLDRAAGYRDPVYIVGDRNVRLDRADDANSRQLTDLLEAYGFSVRETEMTHARGGILDDVATRRDLTPPHVTVFDVGLSDHHLLQWSVPTIRPPPPVVSCRPVVHRRWRLLDVDTLYTNSSVDITALSARQLD